MNIHSHVSHVPFLFYFPGIVVNGCLSSMAIPQAKGCVAYGIVRTMADFSRSCFSTLVYTGLLVLYSPPTPCAWTMTTPLGW